MIRAIDLIAHPLPDRLSLELSTGQHYVERESPLKTGLTFWQLETDQLFGTAAGFLLVAARKKLFCDVYHIATGAAPG